MKLLVLILCMTITGPVFAAKNFCGTGKPSSIDVWFNNAVNKSHATGAGYRDLQGEYYDRWDKKLNRVYDSLMKKLKKPDRKLLRNQERAWIKYRDATYKWYWSGAMYGSGGTISPMIVSSMGTQFVKKRVCQLMQYKKTAYNAHD